MPQEEVMLFVTEAPAVPAKQLREMFAHPEDVGTRRVQVLIRDLVDARAALKAAAIRLAPTIEGDDQKKTKATKQVTKTLLIKGRAASLVGFWETVEWIPLAGK